MAHQASINRLQQEFNTLASEISEVGDVERKRFKYKRSADREQRMRLARRKKVLVASTRQTKILKTIKRIEKVEKSERQWKDRYGFIEDILNVALRVYIVYLIFKWLF